MIEDRTMDRDILILGYDGAQSLDVTGPLEVFAGARELIERTGRPGPSYTVRVLSGDGHPFACSSGLTLDAHLAAIDAPVAIDTLIVAGGPGATRAAADPHLLDWVHTTAANARRTASVCTGAFVLASAGLLDGRRATTHWSAAEELAARHPAVEVDPEPIFLRDGSIWTSAGVTAGMDLALAMVEEDLDRDAALTIARHLVLFLRRPGNQSQFSAALTAPSPRREPLREAQRHAVEHPAAEHTVEAMAARVHMSPRHFARCFQAETGITPARYVLRVRLDAARRRLQDTDEPISVVAQLCGFGSPETMRKAFLRTLAVGPLEYRRRFQVPTEQRSGVSHTCEGTASQAPQPALAGPSHPRSED
jgi:transcriptional regulator GlxA family with amidase domain